MEYDQGVRLDAMLENQEKILKILEWMVNAMADNNIKPKEVKENGSVQSNEKK